MYHEKCTCDLAEQWRKVRDRPYEVSNRARVRNVNSGKLLSPWDNGCGGYVRVQLYKEGTKKKERKNYYLHRLVATYHKKRDCETKSQVNHKKEDPTWCCVCNIEWATYEENIQQRNETNGWNPETEYPF